MTTWTVSADGGKATLSSAFRISTTAQGYFNHYVREWTLAAVGDNIRCERSVRGPDNTNLRTTIPDDSVRMFPKSILGRSDGVQHISNNLGVPEIIVLEGLKQAQLLPKLALAA